MPTRTIATSLLLCALQAAALSEDYTMFHVNPLRFGPKPVNMDTADAAGDLFFEMMQVLTVPLACSDPNITARPFNCRNQEATDPTDVVNKITLTIDNGFSGYAMCNIGSENNTDPLGRPCKHETYCCACEGSNFSHWPPPTVPCNATVGRANIFDHHGGNKSHFDNNCTTDYDCWSERAGSYLTPDNPGWWYSPQSIGDCDEHASPGPNCTWRLKKVHKIVSRTCQSNQFFAGVQAAAPASEKPCFAACGGSSGAVNASDPCWVRCFYKTVLGPDSGKPSGAAGGGLPWEKVVALWEAPFESDDPAKGGCPPLPIPAPYATP